MNYLLCPSTFLALSIATKEDTLFFREEPPSYILNVFLSKKIKCIKSDTILNDAITIYPENNNGLLFEWLGKKEVENLNYWERKFFVNNDNYEYILSNYNNSNYCYYFHSEVSENKIKSFSSKKIIKNAEVKLLPLDIIIKNNEPKENSNIVIKENNNLAIKKNNKSKKEQKILICSDINPSKKYSILIKELEKKYDIIIRSSTYLPKEKYNIVLISDSKNVKKYFNKAKKDGSFVIFFRNSSNFSNNDIIENSNIVICENNYMYKNSLSFRNRNINNTFELNLFEQINIVKQTKDNKKIVYIEKNNLRTDFDALRLILNSGVQVDYWTSNSRHIPSSILNNRNFFKKDISNRKELLDVISKYNFGLVLFCDNYDECNIPLSVNYYLNANIPIIYSNLPSLKSFKNIAFDFNKINLNNFLKSRIDIPKIKFDKIIENNLDFLDEIIKSALKK